MFQEINSTCIILFIAIFTRNWTCLVALLEQNRYLPYLAIPELGLKTVLNETT